MALEMQHLFVRGAPQGEPRVDIFNMGSDSMRPKYNLELSYMATSLSREEWTHGPKAPVDIQGPVWYTHSSWMGWGIEAGIMRYVEEGS